ncbi:hypothetical protein IMZ48_36545 [Candidatus Bathyarchaeota archaeon]|nr:hypothetical protein [Candidatus Bathyarchaeota archaeon]
MGVAAFSNIDGSVAVVLISQGGEGEVTVSAGDASGVARAWVSDDGRQCEEVEVVGEGGEVVVGVAANSITTVVFAAAAEEAGEEPVETPVEGVPEGTPVEEAPEESGEPVES